MSERAIRMRRDKSDAEQKLWRALRDLNRRGFQFRQQAPIGPYIADFSDHSAKLIIEVDGTQHGLPQGLHSDARRTRWLASQGYRVLRFWNHEIFTNFDDVETEIFVALGILTDDGQDGPRTLDAIPSPQRRRRAFGAPRQRRVFDTTGEGKGGGDCRSPAVGPPATSVGLPPTPNPSPQGGGGLASRVVRRRRKTRASSHV